MSISYPYASGALLEHRHSYQYSQYLGQEFLRAWKNNRASALEELGLPMQPPDFQRGQKTILAEFKLQERLEWLMEEVTQGRIDDVKQELALWIKKFELNKRLFDEYDALFNPINKRQYHNLSLYVRYAEIMEQAYCRSTELPYLNVFLKAMDTLIAYRKDIIQEEKSRLAWLVEREIYHVQMLAEQHGLKI